MSDEMKVLLVFLLFVVGMMTAATLSMRADDRREAAERRACESAGGAYSRGGVEYRGTRYHCMTPPASVEPKR